MIPTPKSEPLGLIEKIRALNGSSSDGSDILKATVIDLIRAHEQQLLEVLRDVRDLISICAKEKKFTFEPPHNFRAQTPAHKALAKLESLLAGKEVKLLTCAKSQTDSLCLTEMVKEQPVELPLADKEKLINDMGRAYALLENPKKPCTNCGGDGREPDNTPCSNPNERGKCEACNGRGYWQVEPTYSDRIRAIFAVVEPHLRTSERESGNKYLIEIITLLKQEAASPTLTSKSFKKYVHTLCELAIRNSTQIEDDTTSPAYRGCHKEPNA